jgi:DNA-damage-inducible protein D
MKKETIIKLNKDFESASYRTKDVEFWFARDLQKLLGYTEWRNFTQVIEKAKISCETSNQDLFDHFVDVNKTIPMPKGAQKDIPDIILTRYACYLIAQNGDPRKEQIAFAQSYFALQTRKQELVEERIKLVERFKAREKLAAAETVLSKNIYERGVNEKGFAIIRSKGDQALFGGYNTMEMKIKLGVPPKRPLADFLPTITITAKNLATEITNFNVNKNDLRGENPISWEHIKNNQEVRHLLGKSGIKPEELPPEEDIKKLERKVKSADKKLISKPQKLKEPTAHGDSS